MRLPASRDLGRYHIDERIAVGGMAEIFRARVMGAHGFERPVVIKRILPHLAADPSFVAMFIDEAKITARLDHRNIVHVFELGLIDDELFMAMELVDGCDLLAVLERASSRELPIPAQIAVHVAHELLDALDYAHSLCDDEGRPLGVVHRDVSPSNVLLSFRGDVKLSDFGIARARERPRKTEAGVLKGKFNYMAPEQVNGAATLDGRVDLFAVGILLAELLTGRRLFSAESELDLLMMVRDANLSRFEELAERVDPDLCAIVRRALAREPEARFPTAAAFRDALSDWLFARRLRVAASDIATFLAALSGDPGWRPLAPSTPPRAGVQLTSVPSAPPPAAETVIELVAEPAPEARDSEPSLAAQRESAAPEPAPAAVPGGDEGDLAIESPIAVVHRVASSARTARLAITAGATVRTLSFEGGRLCDVDSTDERERLDAFLIDARIITDLERSFALAMAPRSNDSFATALLDLNVLDSRQLQAAMDSHARSLVERVLALRGGRYGVQTLEPLPRQPVSLELDPMPLLVDAACALPEPLLLEAVRPLVDRFPIAAPGSSVQAHAAWGAEAGRLCLLLDGRFTLQDHLRRQQGPEERLRLLQLVYLLVETRLVTVA